MAEAESKSVFDVRKTIIHVLERPRGGRVLLLVGIGAAGAPLRLAGGLVGSCGVDVTGRFDPTALKRSD